ncbi:MAG: class I SAM-dependent methyltransferase [Parachlamydiaceae bacterium]|nr:class I SAM-dependent methyltransferase [Parachlamydiaceae bacterium]
MFPELLHYAMFLSKNEIVLEVAGGRGENAALLAFSGAKRVYMNDILPSEVESFKKLCTELPSQVQEKIVSVCGNCFELLKLKPELEGKVGLLLCRNLIHFFNDQEQDAFLKLLKNALRPGGRAIITVNASYFFSEHRKILDSSPDNTAWNHLSCTLHDQSLNFERVDDLFIKSSSSKVTCDYQSDYLWLKGLSTNYKWRENPEVYKSLTPDVVKILKKSLTEDKLKRNKIKIKSGVVRLLSNVIHTYRQKSLENLFTGAGFEVEQTFLIQVNGHLFFGDDPYGKVNNVGIIVKAPKGL